VWKILLVCASSRSLSLSLSLSFSRNYSAEADKNLILEITPNVINDSNFRLYRFRGKVSLHRGQVQLSKISQKKFIIQRFDTAVHLRYDTEMSWKCALILN